jgi:hypothetical protein
VSLLKHPQDFVSPAAKLFRHTGFSTPQSQRT